MGASFGPELEKLAARLRRGERPRACAARDAAARRIAERSAAAGADQGPQRRRMGRGLCRRASTERQRQGGCRVGAQGREPLVQRRAAEALVRQGLTPSGPSFAPVADIYALLRSGDRFVRYSGRVALEHTAQRVDKMVMAETNVTALTEGLVALANTASEAQAQSELRPVFEKLVSLMRTSLTPDEKIRVPAPSKSRCRRARRSRRRPEEAGARGADQAVPGRRACGDMGGMHQPHAACGPVQPVPLDPSPRQGARPHGRA